jgi:mono/diheme cytochrome c family protein
MKRAILNTLLLVATLALLALNWAFAPDAGARNFEFLPNMAVSVPYDTYATNPNFADGATLRRPVPGTIVRGQMPLHYAATKEDAEGAGRELTSPLKRDVKTLERGAFVYATYCETCHGPHGLGDGLVAKRGFPAPPSFLAPRALTMADGQMFHVVTYGQANMPSYASQVGREDRWRVIEYVRKLQGVRR